MLKYLLLGGVLAAGLVAGYGIIGTRAGYERSSAHHVSERATNVPGAAAQPESTTVVVGATRTPIPHPALQVADLAALQVEMEQLDRRVAELKGQPGEGAMASDTTVAELQQLLDASQVALTQLDALIAQQARSVATPVPSSSGMSSMGEMGGGSMSAAATGGGLHGHH